MTGLEKAILREIADLPEARLPDVLAFIRYLKLTLAEEQQIEERFERALRSVRARSEQINLTEEDIEAEVRAVREGDASRT
jgi:hypothetical protein